MAATEIKIEIASVSVIGDAHRHEWTFQGNVRQLPSKKSAAIGNSADQWEVSKGNVLNMAGWTATLKIQPGDKQIEINLKGQRVMGWFTKGLGTVKMTINTPVLHGYDLTLTSNKGQYSARIKVTVTADTEVAVGTISTITTGVKSNAYSTIHDGMETRMVHICPVVPVPWAKGIPPIPKGVASLTASDPEDLGAKAGNTAPNTLVNPAVIPVIAAGDRAYFDKHCARIRITQYRPKTLKNDFGKLIWKAKTDNIRFYAGGPGKKEVKGGQEVKAYGVLKGKNDEEGVIEVRWDGEGQPLLAVFRAWVGRPKYLKVRANIIKCSTAKINGEDIENPTIDFADIRRMVEYNNVILWQAGIKMLMDQDATVYNGAVRQEAGIFVVTSDKNYTCDVDDSPLIVAPLLNHRAGILNIAFIHSVKGDPDLLGWATDRRLTAKSKKVSLGGSPSTSWLRPTGVYPDDPGQKVKMKTMGPSDARPKNQKPLAGDGEIGKISGLAMTALSTKDANNITLAHELCHVLGLHHRGSGGWKHPRPRVSTDEVNHLAGPNKGEGHPWGENLMAYGDHEVKQDIDMIQTMAIRKHKLLAEAPPKPTAPHPEKPKIPPPKPTAPHPEKPKIPPPKPTSPHPEKPKVPPPLPKGPHPPKP